MRSTSTQPTVPLPIRAQEETEVLAKKSDKGANCKEEKDELDINVY